MKAYFFSNISNPKVYVNDEFIGIAQEISALGYESEWRKPLPKPSIPKLMDSYSKTDLDGIRDMIGKSQYVAVDSRYQDIDAELYNVVLGILIAERPRYGTYIISGSDDDQNLVVNSAKIVEPTFSKVRMEADGTLFGLVDGYLQPKTIQEVLRNGFESLVINDSVSTANKTLLILLGYAYTAGAMIEYNPVNPSSLIKVLCL